MKVFLTGTDTNVGKTLISAWLCHHLKYAYWKPIQTGVSEGSDTDFIFNFDSTINTYPETYVFQEPVSPHLAAKLNNINIIIHNLDFPKNNNVIIEGAGGVFAPINQDNYIIDLIKYLSTPVIIVAGSELGTINHTLLTLQALRNHHIPILGVIMNHYHDSVLMRDNKLSIEKYGQVPVLTCFPKLDNITSKMIKQIKLSEKLIKVFNHD